MYKTKDDEIKKLVKFITKFEKCKEIREVLEEHLYEVTNDNAHRNFYDFNENKFMLMEKADEKEEILTCSMLQDGKFYFEQTWQQFKKDDPNNQIGIGYHHIYFTEDGLLQGEESRTKYQNSPLYVYACHFVGNHMLYSLKDKGTYLFTGEIASLCQTRKIDTETFSVFLDDEDYAQTKLSDDFMERVKLTRFAKTSGLEPVVPIKEYKKEDC